MLAGAERHVVENGQAVEQGGHLEQESEPETRPAQFVLASSVGQIAAVELNDPARRLQQRDHQLEHDRLAAAALADDRRRSRRDEREA